MIKVLTQEIDFPDPSKTGDNGLVAIGGDLSIERLSLAYRSGIFPWFSEGEIIQWYSPNPRMVFDLEQKHPLRITKSMKQSAKNRGYHIEENTQFQAVITACANHRRNYESGTWITSTMIKAYCQLHEIGLAKSIEVYLQHELIGGLYGIDLPEYGIFCGESMFSKARDASKVALMYLAQQLKAKQYKLIDAQMYTDHLESLGGKEIHRDEFLAYLVH